MIEDPGGLPEVIEDEARERGSVPGERDEPLAEVAHVGVERLRAGHREDDRAQERRDLGGTVLKEVKPVDRVEPPQDPEILGDPPAAEGPEGGKPDEHDRPEHPADGLGPALLRPEEHGQDDDRDGHDEAVEPRVDGVQSLRCAENRDCRGDDAVAVKECGPNEDHDDGEAQSAAHGRGILGIIASAVDQGQQGKDAALAVVVGLHDKPEVLHAHDQHQRPEDERAHAEDVLDVVAACRKVREALVHRVQRARPDVAEHDAQRSEGQGRFGGDRLLGGCVRTHGQGWL